MLRAIEPTNSNTGHDWYHRHLLVRDRAGRARARMGGARRAGAAERVRNDPRSRRSSAIAPCRCRGLRVRQRRRRSCSSEAAARSTRRCCSSERRSIRVDGRHGTLLRSERSSRRSPKIRPTSASWSSSRRSATATGTPASSRSIPATSRAFHEYPFLVYEFADGVYVIGQIGGHDLVGARLTAVGGIPIAQVLAQREAARAARQRDDRRQALPRDVSAQRGGAGRARHRAEVRLHPPQRRPGRADAGGRERRRVLAARSTASGPRMWPNGAAHAARPATRRRACRCSRTAASSTSRTTRRPSTRARVAARVARLASKPKVRRVVVDLRNNLGGDNTRIRPLIRRAAAARAQAQADRRARRPRDVLRGGQLHGRPRDGDALPARRRGQRRRAEPLRRRRAARPSGERASRRGRDDLVGEEQARRRRPARHVPSRRRRAADGEGRGSPAATRRSRRR